MRHKYQALLALLLFCFALHASAQQLNEPALSPQANSQQNLVDLAAMQWRHGSKSCSDDNSPTIQVERAGANSYVLRQNKCVTFEAPFIYVLMGQNKVLVLDTGANESPEESPLYDTVRDLVRQHEKGFEKEILVLHSHSHADHTAGDSQFLGKNGVDVVSTDQQKFIEQLRFKDWPQQSSEINLGGRKITVIPIPGHQKQSIAVYDHHTDWLLTGDTFYPGLIRVKNWDEFRNSIQRLVDFSKENSVSLVLGAHIEMNAVTNEIYQIGSKHQPNEPPLALTVNHLKQLNSKLQQTSKPQKLKFDSFVISPLSRFEKMLNSILSKI